MSKKVDVVLTALQDRVRIMQAIMSVSSMGLKESKIIADNPPAVVVHCTSEKMALTTKKILEDAGGTVEICEAENC